MSATETIPTRATVRTLTAPAIQTQELAKRYGRIDALAGLTMTVPRGEVFGFLGPNGAGKTTAVKLLLGLVKPTSGGGTVLGAPIGDRETRRRIGYLPELFRYQGWLTAREVLALHCELAGIPREKRAGEIREILETVGLAPRADDRVETFSKGMQQRLGLGVALLGKPDLIFLDEPTSALDPVGRHDVREIIHQTKARGATVFLNSHLLSEVELVCDRVAIVDKGRVIALGALAEILGATSQVRLRIEGLGTVAEAALAQFGQVERQGDWFTVRGIAEGAVPDLVATVVRQGGRIFAVEPAQQTLEDRFLQLLGGQRP
jgi:ABC-2 type transport system ATP-binding protein